MSDWISDYEKGVLEDREFYIKQAIAARDKCENARRELTQQINSLKADRENLEDKFGQVWNTEELAVEFEVQGFLAIMRTTMDESSSARDRLYDRIVEWMRQKQDYSFRRFLSVCSKDIGVFVKDDRKTEAVSQLVRCLKEIERMKLVESHYVDDLIQSIAQRWNIVEIS